MRQHGCQAALNRFNYLFKANYLNIVLYFKLITNDTYHDLYIKQPDYAASEIFYFKVKSNNRKHQKLNGSVDLLQRRTSRRHQCKCDDIVF